MSIKTEVIEPDANEDEDGYSSGGLKIDEDEKHVGKKTPTKKKKRSTRKNESSDEEIKVLPKMCAEVEENLVSTAAKNRLTAANVKNILKRVVSNEHVLALVKIREEELEEEEQVISPKITRARAKERPQSSWPFQITPVKSLPIKVTSPEVTKLIAQDLPEEESDEEYQPNLDEASDDERDTISSISDVDSQPRTPATPDQSLDVTETSPVKWTDDGLFKIPPPASVSCVKEEPTIALRTRSKLSLNDTPIEVIEQSFVPPDDDVDDDQIDNIWTDFLIECTNPKTPDPPNEDDEEMDPEYNAEQEKVDEEEICGDDEDIEVTRTEFDTLIAELYESMDTQFMSTLSTFQDGFMEPMGPNINLIPTILQETHQEIKTTSSPIKILDISKSQPVTMSENDSSICNTLRPMEYPLQTTDVINDKVKIENHPTCPVQPNKQEAKSNGDSTEDYANITDEDLKLRKKSRKKRSHRHPDVNGLTTMNQDTPEWVFQDGDGKLSAKQREILDQQLRQHIQLATSNYLQLYAHPKLWSLAPQQKEFLTSLSYLSGDNPMSAFRPCNLVPAIQLCEDWEMLLAEDTEENRNLMKDLNKQCEISLMYLERPEELKKRRRFSMKFPDKLVHFMLGSRGVFLYLDMLPRNPARTDTSSRSWFLPSEDQLTAIALEEFIQYANANPKLFPGNVDKSTQIKGKVMELITRYLVVAWTPQKLARRISDVRMGRITVKSNAVKYYIDHGKAPETYHAIKTFDAEKRLIDMNHGYASGWWSKFLREKKSRQEHIVKLKADIERIKKEGIDASKRFVGNPEDNNSQQTVINLDSDENPQIEVKYTPNETSIAENNINLVQSDKTVLIKVVDQSGNELYHSLGPILTLNTSSCETVQSIAAPIVTTCESDPINKEIVSNNRLSVIKHIRPRRRWKSSSSEYSAQSSDTESGGPNTRSRLTKKHTNFECNPHNKHRPRRNDSRRNKIFQQNFFHSNQIGNVSSSNNNCVCNCQSSNANLINESLPKGQTLLTKYFKKLSKSGGNNSSVEQNNLNGSVVCNKSTNRVEPASLKSSRNQFNCVDSTSTIEPTETETSNLHIYNDNSYNLKTILSRLKHLLFVNWKSRAYLNNGGLSRLKTPFAKSARAKLLKEIFQVDSTMLPSMPYLSTPSKSSFDDDCNEIDNHEVVVVEASKTAGTENSVETKENTSTTPASKRVEDKSVTPGKGANSKLNLSNATPKTNVKATKAQKELEASRAMFAVSDPFVDEMKDTTFATAFFEKVQERLKAKFNSDQGGRDDFFEFQNILSTFDAEKETPCDLYFKLEKLFGTEHDDLTEEFLTFLTAGQAVQIGRFMDHFVLTSMTNFIERLQIYFARRPTQLRKILWSLNQIVDDMDSSDDNICMEKIKSTILPHLKGNQYLINWFMRLFPMDRPQDNLVNGGYEVLDVEKLSKELGSEDTTQIDKLDFEVVNIPSIEDSFGTNACQCDCHNTNDEKYKSRSKHCTPCGMRYVQGRLYIPHGKGLRPGRISWSNEEESKRQALRLGLMQNRSIAMSSNSAYSASNLSTISSSSVQLFGTGRKRAASHEPHIIRESDDERVSPKRSVKCLRTPTSKTKFSKLQLVKNSKTSNTDDTTKPSCSKSIIKDDRLKEPVCSTKDDECEKLAESLPSGDNEDAIQDETLVSKVTEGVEEDGVSPESNGGDPWMHDSIDIYEQPLFKREKDSSDLETDDVEVDVTSQEDDSEITVADIKIEDDEHMWTRDEDKAILVVLQCESDMNFTFEKIKQLLPHRSIDQIKERFQSVMQLLHQMASDR